MNIPGNLMYTASHEWVEFLDDTTAKVGITEFAQHGLGDIVFINLPKPGNTITKEESVADIESVKAVSDVYSPFTGKIAAINEDVSDTPQNINSDPYGSWLVEISDITDRKRFFNAGEYEKFCEEEK